MFVGIISGIISGLIVTAGLWLLDYLKRPRFILSYVSDNRAVMRYKGFRPVIIGGSFILHEGSVLYRPDGFRGGDTGLYVKPFSDTIFHTENFTAGQTVHITYRYFGWWPKPRQSKILHAENTYDLHPCDHFGNEDKYPGWKSAYLVMHAR